MSWNHTIACREGDWSDWHRGRPWYYIWGFVLQEKSVLERIQAVREAFEPFLLPLGVRQPHITVQALGFIDSPETDPVVQQQITALCSRRPAITSLQAGSWDSFASALYLRVLDAGNLLETLRDSLQTVQNEDRDVPYVAHVTAGLYNAVVPRREIDTRLSRQSDLDPVRLHTPALSLLRYSTDSICGPLQSVAEYDLCTNAVRWNTHD